MRPLHETTTRLMRGSHLAPILLVTLTTYTDRAQKTVDTIFRFSHRGFYYDYGNTGTEVLFEPLLDSMGEFRSSINHLPGAEGPGVFAKPLDIVLTNSRYRLDDYLYTTLRNHRLEGAAVEVAELLLPNHPDAGELIATTRAMEGAEHVVWWRGRVGQVGPIDVETIRLQCTTDLPEYQWLRTTSQLTADPKDIGRAFPVIYGSASKVEAIGYDVGWVSPLLAAATQSDETLLVTDTAGFATEGEAFIAGEQIGWTDKTPGSLLEVTRGLNGTTIREHAAGELVVEVRPTTVYVLAAHASFAVLQGYAISPFTGAVIGIGSLASFGTVNLSDTSLIAGETLTTLTFSQAQMRTLVARFVAEAEVTQQPVISHGLSGSTSFGNIPTACNAAGGGAQNCALAYDADLGTWARIKAQSNFGELVYQFAAFPGATQYTLNVNWDPAEMTAFGTIYVRHGVEPSPVATLGSFNQSTPAGVYSFTVTSSLGETRFSFIGTGNAFQGWGRIVEIDLDVDSQASAPQVVTPAEIAAAQVGHGVRLLANVRGVVTPSVSPAYVGETAGQLMNRGVNHIRHWIEEIGGQTVEPVAYDFAANERPAAFGVDARNFGGTWAEVLSRMAHEIGVNVVPEERDAGTQWLMLASDSSWHFPTPTRTLTAWREFAEIGRALGTEIATFFQLFYGFEAWKPREEQYARSIRASPVSGAHDVTNPSLAEMQTAQAEFGDLLGSPFLFHGFPDNDNFDLSAAVSFSYHVHELIRAARMFSMTGVPWWEAYDLEIGDTVYVTPPWEAAPLACRILEYRKDTDTETGLIALRLVEVEL